jgi:23S rRNA (cytidine1920-2'-O)/16S rRNA (cytidine1409-2'-O)-methyltransferase
VTAVAKQRLDVALVERGLAETRAAAQRLVMAGLVFSGDKRLDKAGQSIAADAELEVRGQPHPYVSRGGLKLERALDHFAIPVMGRIALDVGASTGGFTDCLLQRGAAKVYAVDVGRDQLHAKLRADPRVVVLEGTDARSLDAKHVKEPAGAIVADVSFISLTLVLPPAFRLAAPGAWLVALVKPQFEAGRDAVGKGGIVRDPAKRKEAVAKVLNFIEKAGWTVIGEAPSPIKGGSGNEEILIGARHGA